MNDTQSMLRDMQGRFLADRYGSEARQAIIRSDAGWSAEIWQEMADLGLLAAPLPEAHGGLGGDDDLLVLMEEFGRRLLVEPYVSAVVIGGTLFKALGDGAALDAIAAGTMRLALAHDESPEAHGAADIASTAQRTEGGFLLSATKLMVQDAPAATHLAVSARLEDGKLGLFLVPADAPGLVLNAFPMIDGRRAANLSCEALALPASALLSASDRTLPLIHRLLDAATLAVCGEAIGIMRAMLDETVGYTRERKQFGQALASFQVLQHRMADMLVDIEQAQSVTLRAALSRGNPEAIAAAKVRVNGALKRVSHAAVQLHGGIGTTEELMLGQYFRRAAAIQRQYGTSAHHLAQLQAHLAEELAGAPASAPHVAAHPADDADEAFRAEVRAFLDQAFTPELRREADRQAGVFAEPALAAKWQTILYEKGWVAPSWPVEYGGTGWTPRQRLIFEHECALANTPVLPAMGLQMCGPVLIGYGTEEQKAFFLPKILSGEHRWCQGYSEPGAGSDLASLKCRMVRDGDDYVINGTKIWTTYAHVANWMFLLARTDPDAKPQAGISFVLVPMDAPGITVTPILSMSGEHEVNQVFLDNVRVPVSYRVGPENQGWTVAKFLLEFERGGAAATARTLRVVGLIRRLAAAHGGLACKLLNRLTKLEIEVAATEWTQQRMLTNIEAGKSIGNANASILKLKASELYQEASMLFLDALGAWGLVDQRAALEGKGPLVGPEIAVTGAARYMNSRAMSIFGGSSEIQRTILAKQALGL